MASSANTWGNPAGTVGTLNGFFKETYADKLGELIPDGVKLLNKIKFMSKDKQPGNLYHQPVILGMEHGVTFASSDDDAFNLNPPVAGVIKDAQIKGNPVVMRSLLGYVAASRAALGGQKAFMDATKFLVANMLRINGQEARNRAVLRPNGLCNIASGSGTATLTITTAEWAPGIWAGAEGMPIEIRDTTGATVRGQIHGQVGRYDRSYIDHSKHRSWCGITTDVVWHLGAYGNEFPGLHKILTQSSGTCSTST
jgi:hypothetical protein